MVSTIGLTYAQEVKVVTDSVYKATINNIRSTKGRATKFRYYENGQRGLLVSAGASYNFLAQPRKATDGFNAALAVSYRFGKHGGAQIGVGAEGGNTTTVQAFFKQNLGRYYSKSWIIPEIGVYAGASDQLMWSGASTDPSAPQGVAMKVACPRFAFCASAELSLKIKPAPKKEPRFFIELCGGYRVTPYWGKEMSVNNISLSNSKVYPIDNPLPRRWGYFYTGIKVGFAIYRLAK